jgi:hypothetical protein
MALIGIPPARGAARGLSVSIFSWIVLMALVLGAAPTIRAQAPVAHEYQLKAVFLFYFSQFVDWPPTAFTSPQAPLIIGILGDDPFGNLLDEAVRGERVNNRAISVRRFRSIEDVADCHILFIALSAPGQIEEALTKLKGRSILTVSDSDNFSHLGGMIRFVTENNKIRLKINLGAARAAGLTISSKLLRPAEIISMRRRPQ